MNEKEIVESSLQKARARFPRAGAWKLYREAKKIARKEHKAGSWTVIISLLWPLVVELFWKK